MTDHEFCELKSLFNHFVEAGRSGRWAVADAYSRCMQQLLEAGYPKVARALRSAASRKGVGLLLSDHIATNVDARGAAAISLVLILRRARRSTIAGIVKRFDKDAAFIAAQFSICRGLF